MPSVSFFLSTTDHPIDEAHPLWPHPLPGNRSPHGSSRESIDAETITYGQYFSTVARFCATGGWERIANAASRMLERPVEENDLQDVFIFLEKHGAFYHPARLRVVINDQTLSLVVNVAASSRGKRALQHELKALEHLNEQRPFGWFPNVYASVCDDLPMFLGDWFVGFHEFHLTRRPGSDEAVIMVWNKAAAPYLLSDHQAAALYRNMAMILTACYDPISARQIFPWHHAAGDFVVRMNNDGLAVKLITVRNYIPLAGSAVEPEDERSLLDALVVFLIHLSMRMRLDRLDGVAEVVWAPDLCLEPMIEGFFQGLDLTARINGLPEALLDTMRLYFNQYDATDLTILARRIAQTVYDRRTEEHAIIHANLSSHVEGIIHILAP